MDPVAEIKRLYYATGRATIQRDIDHAIALLKTLTTEEDRERAAVYMDGLSQMRSEWGVIPPAPAASRSEAGSAHKSKAPSRTARASPSKKR